MLGEGQAEFLCFSGILFLLIFFHKWAIPICMSGLVALLSLRIFFLENLQYSDILSLILHELPLLFNVGLMILAFGIIVGFIRRTHIDRWISEKIGRGYQGAALLLVGVFCFSPLLDNIAVALLGGSIAASCLGRLHPFYILGIAAVANAGGSWSVLGDTTTTLLWLSGIPALSFLSAFLPALISSILCIIPASYFQMRHMTIRKEGDFVKTIENTDLSYRDSFYMVFPFFLMISVHLLSHIFFADSSWLGYVPLLGITLWFGLFGVSFYKPIPWEEIYHSWPEVILLIFFILLAIFVPVNSLPTPTFMTTLLLGLVSSFFDNIPLTLLASKQGGYDWALLAYAVGFGGSCSWFGSTAGVCLSGSFPEIRQVRYWVPAGLWIMFVYLLGGGAYFLIYS